MNLLPTFKYSKGEYWICSHEYAWDACIGTRCYFRNVSRVGLRIIFDPRRQSFDGLTNDLIMTTVIYEQTISPREYFQSRWLTFNDLEKSS